MIKAYVLLESIEEVPLVYRFYRHNIKKTGVVSLTVINIHKQKYLNYSQQEDTKKIYALFGRTDSNICYFHISRNLPDTSYEDYSGKALQGSVMELGEW
jgi:hypothetical protein